MHNSQKGINWGKTRHQAKIAPMEVLRRIFQSNPSVLCGFLIHESLFEILKWVWKRLQIKHPTAAEMKISPYMDDLQYYSKNSNTTESTE